MKRGGFSRTQRIAGLMQTALAEILQQEVEDARFRLTTITGVTVSRDMSFAKVFVSTLEEGKEREVVVALNHAAKHIRHALAHKIELRVIPELKFYYDDSSMRGHHISSLLNSALKDVVDEDKKKK